MSPLGVEDVRVVVAVPLDDRLVTEAAPGLQVVRVGEEVTRSAASVDASPMLLWSRVFQDIALRSIQKIILSYYSFSRYHEGNHSVRKSVCVS